MAVITAEGMPLAQAPAGPRPGIQVVSIAANWQWSLMFYHVAGGGLWTGIGLFVGFVVGPILGRLSIPARAEFSSKFMPMMVLIMPTLVLMTLAACF